jgi:multicomponent Na+:H+ antiporter subunit F
MMAVLALLPPLAVPVLVACRGATASRLVAVQLATAVTTLILALLSFALDQSSFIDLALCLALMSLPGTLVLANFVERWL